MIRSHQRLACLAILCIYLGLGAVYSWINPIFESPDELRHYPYVKQLADGGGLPIQRPGEETLWEQEGSQPPLYYALAALLTGWINTDDLPALRQVNPHAQVGIPLAPDNKNVVLHLGHDAFPWRGTALAVHLVRLFSLFLGLGTLLCTYALARALYPQRPELALGALAVNALIPQFLFISASVNNDNLVTLLSSLALLLMVRWVLRPAPRWRLLLLGAVIGLACLSKLSGIGLLPLAAAALALGRWPQRPSAEAPSTAAPSSWPAAIRAWLADLAYIVVPVLLIAGWWYGRNLRLYGDPFGLNAMLALVGRRATLPTLADLWGEGRGFVMSFWGLFGAFNILMRPAWVYPLLNGLALLSFLGLLRQIVQGGVRRPTPRALALVVPVLQICIVLASWARWTALTLASQGRLIFPAMGALCLLLVLGWTSLVPRRYALGALAVPATVLLALAASSPLTAIRPAYARPPILSISEVPPSARPFEVTYGDRIRLLAYEVDRKLVRPGESLAVTLYWQALAPIPEQYSISLQAFGYHEERLGQRDTYPGGGNYPTSLWREGRVIRDTILLPIAAKAQGPVALALEVGLYRLETMEKLPAADALGRPVGRPILTRIKLQAPTAVPSPGRLCQAHWVGAVRLVGFDLDETQAYPGGTLPLTLHWQVTGTLDRDYTIFVQLVDAQGRIVGQGDGPPLEGYYPTSFWAPGEHLGDSHTVTIQPQAGPGPHRLLVGFYDLATGARLPLWDDAGRPSGDAFTLAEVTLHAPEER